MIIKRCDVCKNETDTLYDKKIATHVDVINGVEYIRQNKLHICRTCMASVIDVELKSELNWYEENIKEDIDGKGTSSENTNTGDNGGNDNTEGNGSGNPEDGDGSESNSNDDNITNDNEDRDSEDVGGTTTGD